MICNPADLQVVVVDAAGVEYPLALSSGFIASGAGNSSGGNVTTVAAYDNTHTVTIFREIDATQPASFEENDAFPAKTTETALDRVTMVCQQVLRKVSRCFQVSEASPAPDPLQINTQTPVNSIFVSGDDGKLHLWSVARLQQEISMLAAVPAMLNALQILYPVGALYFTLRPENPNVTLGFGTWVRYGSGRMIVSLDPGNPICQTLGQIGGEAAHLLTGLELPSHVHVVPAQTPSTGAVTDHAHTTPAQTINATTGGQSADHSHGYTRPDLGLDASDSGSGVRGVIQENVQTAGSSNDHNHGVTVNIPAATTGAAGGHSHPVTIPQQNTQAAGGGQAHNNMPPYLGGYMSKSLANRPPEAKGSRFVGYSQGFHRRIKGTFSWNTAASWVYRQKLATHAARGGIFGDAEAIFAGMRAIYGIR